MFSFSVLTEPWIPAMNREGQIRFYGILEMLERAHCLDGIVDPAPPIQFGLYRLVIAFLMDALGLQETNQLVQRLEEGHFDMSRFHEYVSQCGLGRFDLFDPLTPFLQPVREAAKPKSVSNLLPHLPSGTFTTHFHHWREGDHAFSPEVCARALTVIAPFMTAGGAGYSPSINGAPPWYVLVRGTNLFETLLLNCYTGETSGLERDEGPAWRSTKSVIPKQDAYCDSLLEGLTWRPRLVRLIPGKGGICTYSGKPSPVLIREMLWGPGLAFVGQDSWRDPNVAYVYSAKGRSPLRVREDRELWRDTGPLLLLRREEHGAGENKLAFDRPLVVNQLRRLRDDYGFFHQRRFDWVEVYGLRTDGKMKVFEWQYERLELPVGVSRNQRAPGQVRTAIQMAESVAWCLKEGLSMAYPREGKGNQNAFGRIIREAQWQFWTSLRSFFQVEFLQDLAVQDSDDDLAQERLLAAWGQTLRRMANAKFEEALDPLDADAQALHRQASAREEFRRRLWWAVMTPAARAARTKRKGRATSHG